MDDDAQKAELITMFDRDFSYLDDSPETKKRMLAYKAGLQSLVLTANGYQPREWVEQFQDRIDKPVHEIDFNDIAIAIDPDIQNKTFWASGLAYNDLDTWRKTRGQDRYRVFTGTINYLATGEGNTLVFAAARAYSSAEFHLWLASKVGAYYSFIADIYEGLSNDRTTDYLVSDPMKRMIQEEVDAAPNQGGHLQVVFQSHVNYS